MEILHVEQVSQPSPYNVQQYLDGLSQLGDGFEHRGGLVGRLCAECIVVFRATLRAISNNKEALNRVESYTSLERSYGRLKLWSDGHGIAAGKFDEVFDKSTSLRQTILKLLISISRILIERLMPLACAEQEISVPAFARGVHTLTELQIAAETVQNDGSSDTSDDLDSDTIDDVVEDLETDTTCLADLDHLLKDPILKVDIEKVAPGDRLLDWRPDRVYSHKIGARFPQADDSLVGWLGKANYMRYLRCQEAREACAKAAVQVAAPAQDIGVRSEAASSKFNDSGLGSSLPSTMSCAETVMSYGGRSGQSVKIPPLTPEAKAGIPFSCVACGKPVSFTSNILWKRHLFLDLQPWMCLDMACPSRESPFETRQDWVSHLALDHKLDPEWASFSCQLCLEPTGSGRIAITRHLGAHLEEVSLAAIPSQLDFDDDSNQSRSSLSADEESLEDEAVRSAALLSTENVGLGWTRMPTTHGLLWGAALEKGNTAAELIKAKDFEGASNACAEACDLFQQAATKERDVDVREHLLALGDIYADRMRELDIIIFDQAESEMKPFQSPSPESPRSEGRLLQEQPMPTPPLRRHPQEATPQTRRQMLRELLSIKHSSAVIAAPPEELPPDDGVSPLLPEGPQTESMRKNTTSSTKTNATHTTGATITSNEIPGTPYSLDASPSFSSQRVFSVKDGTDLTGGRRASRRRTGPLSTKQREKAALMRKLGACNDCRKRLVACHPNHHNMTWEDALRKYRSSTPTGQKNAELFTPGAVTEVHQGFDDHSSSSHPLPPQDPNPQAGGSDNGEDDSGSHTGTPNKRLPPGLVNGPRGGFGMPSSRPGFSNFSTPLSTLIPMLIPGSRNFDEPPPPLPPPRLVPIDGPTEDHPPYPEPYTRHNPSISAVAAGKQPEKRSPNIQPRENPGLPPPIPMPRPKHHDGWRRTTMLDAPDSRPLSFEPQDKQNPVQPVDPEEREVDRGSSHQEKPELMSWKPGVFTVSDAVRQAQAQIAHHRGGINWREEEERSEYQTLLSLRNPWRPPIGSGDRALDTNPSILAQQASVGMERTQSNTSTKSTQSLKLRAKEAIKRQNLNASKAQMLRPRPAPAPPSIQHKNPPMGSVAGSLPTTLSLLRHLGDEAGSVDQGGTSDHAMPTTAASTASKHPDIQLAESPTD